MKNNWKRNYRKFIQTLNDFVPIESKRISSLFSISLAVIIAGYLAALGEYLFNLTKPIVLEIFPWLIKIFVFITSYTVPVNLNIFTVIIFAVILLPLYRFIDRKLLQGLKRVTVFEDDFSSGNKGWILNYWGSNNPEKTCRFENSQLVFEATDEDLSNSNNENGAYFDLTNGIYEGSKYEVSCWVKSEQGTNMGFQLWLHDIHSKNTSKFPLNFYTPGQRYSQIKVGFEGTSSNGMRIHLHYKAGNGKLFANKVKVITTE